MPARIVSLHNKADEIMYPETVVSAVHMLDGRRTLQAEIDELKDESCITRFNSDGSITKVMTNSGLVITTSFGDGSIVDTCTYSDGTLFYTKTTTFESDGSITVSKVYADNHGSTPTNEEETQEGEGE